MGGHLKYRGLWLDVCCSKRVTTSGVNISAREFVHCALGSREFV